jgi:hypothetical protein
MRKHRFWMEIVLLATGGACVLALLIATVGVAAGAASAQAAVAQTNSVAGERTYEGMVTCSRCGAKHSPALDQPATVCVRMCVHGGATFALIGGDSMYLLDGDVEAFKRLAGQRARIVGDLNGRTIKVMSIAAAS